jgi:hypothetical protein
MNSAAMAAVPPPESCSRRVSATTAASSPSNEIDRARMVIHRSRLRRGSTDVKDIL